MKRPAQHQELEKATSFPQVPAISFHPLNGFCFPQQEKGSVRESDFLKLIQLESTQCAS